jgi:hypothetical protein
MVKNDIRPGETVWHQRPGTNVRYQVLVVAVGPKRVKVKNGIGYCSWVNPKNLFLTS